MLPKIPANNHYYFIGADMRHAVYQPVHQAFDNPDVRKAISMGIDRKMVVQTAEYNYIPPADATGLGDIYAVLEGSRRGCSRHLDQL